MNNIIISHTNGDISLDKLQKLVDEISLVQHKDELAFTTNTTQALIDKIVELNGIIYLKHEALKDLIEKKYKNTIKQINI